MQRRSTFVCAAIVMAAGLLTASGLKAEAEGLPLSTDWPRWRGPHGTGIAPPQPQPPMRWSDTQNIVWRQPIPGRGHASPTVVADRVYLPTADHENNRQLVLCFDRATGKPLWQTVVHEGGLMDGNKKASQASPTIACDGERLFVNFLNDGAVYTTALSLDGRQLWQTKISNYVVHQGYGSSPAPYKHLVLVSADNKGGGAIAGLERATGKIIWRVERPQKPNYPSPIVHHINGRDQLFFTGCDLVASFDPLTGKQLWQIDGATTECVTTTVTDGVHIYSSGGYPRNHVEAIRADGSGTIVWKDPSRVYVPSMIVHKGYLYAVGDGGVAVCWKSDTGEVAWKHRLGGDFTASLVLVGEHFYATNETGQTFIFKADPTACQVLATNKLGDEVLPTPAICGGRIYMRVAQHEEGKRREYLFCIGEAVN